MKNFKVTDMNDTMANDSQSFVKPEATNKSFVERKKKVLLNQVKKLNNKGMK